MPTDVEGTSTCIAANGPAWDGPKVIPEEVTRDGSRPDREGRLSNDDCERPRSLSTAERDISKQIIDLLMGLLKESKMTETRCEELAEAFEYAADLPPITKQSLSELDIHNIINNIKLRHDVNFDRDLSFRPNNEGPKGQQKRQQSDRYWLALEAELHLYMRLFQGTPPLRPSGRVDQSDYFKHAQRRIPKMFETIHGVLKSLVPDRDYDRVDEHLDVRMLMQEIERGICDMVKLAEWIAQLLKEHCAPMRDDWVDQMVAFMREGAAETRPDVVVESLNRLLAMLETMKLDVANHQIRNLKPLLIDDTVNFEKHYHLDQIVNRRTKVNVDAAQEWWTFAVQEFQQLYPSTMSNTPRTQSEIFARAVVSDLFSRNSQQEQRELPDTFYLDFDRLRVLRSEIEDLVHFDICFTMFEQLLKEFGYSGTVSDGTKCHLRSSLAAIIGEGVGQGLYSWMCNSEPLSLEIYRQAQLIAGRTPVFSYNTLQNANQRLRSLFVITYASHASTLETAMVQQILSCVNKHHTSSPTELYNSLVVALPPPISMQSFVPSAPVTDTFSFSINTSHDRFHDLAKRISHLVILHWRVWATIAYVQENTFPTTANLPPPPRRLTPPQQTPKSLGQMHPTSPPPPPAPTPPAMEHDMQVVKAMKTGEPPDPGSGYENSVSKETRLP
ncbi:Protein SOSEKI 1 [Kalmusia sp. IMI 367209]|nr:Protein SOSEKI 1 [Kalmusia sp. IMI 367209]